MVLCVVFSCGSRSDRDKGIVFYRIPSVIKNEVFLRRIIDFREERKIDTSDKSQRHHVRIMVKIDQHGLPKWLSWACRIITFKLYFLLHKHIWEGFFLFIKMIGGFVEFVFSKGWLCIRRHCSINIWFKFLTAEWYVVTKGNKRCDLSAFVYV